MAATKTKPRSLDAICAKLKRISNDSPSPETVALSKLTSFDNEIPDHKESNNNVDMPGSLYNGKRLEVDQNEDTNSNCDSPLDLRENLSCAVPSSSRRKRKSAVPRNINQVRDRIDQIDDIDNKDELAEYTLNNQNTDFPPENESDEGESLESEIVNNKPDLSNDSAVGIENGNGNSIDVATALAAASAIRETNQHSSASSTSFYNKKHSRKASNPKSSLITNAPLDLSMSRSSGSEHIIDSDVEGPEDLSFSAENLSKTADHIDTAEDLSKPAGNIHKSAENMVKSPDSSGLKDYAESTMNELLQMYGFSGNSDGMARQAQLSNFNPNQLLQSTMSQGKDIAKVITAVSQKNGFTNIVDRKGIYSNFVNTAHKLQTDGRFFL